MPSTATRNVLPYSARVLLYSTRVRLYKVGGIWWGQVVVRKVSRGGPVTDRDQNRSLDHRVPPRLEMYQSQSLQRHLPHLAPQKPVRYSVPIDELPSLPQASSG